MKESKTLEWKEMPSSSFLKTVSAFANYHDGTVLFGVRDDGSTVGITDPEQVCLSIETKINDSIYPNPDYTLKVRPDDTIELSVKKGTHQPYLYKGKAYKRNDTATIEVDRFELNRLTLLGSGISYESLPARRQSYTFHLLEEELKKALSVESLSLDILRTLDLYASDTGYNHAAELVADENDCFGVDCAYFGSSINEIYDRETICHCSVLKQYHDAYALYSRYYQYEKIDAAARKTEDKIPHRAFREALINALVHRSWDIPAHVRIAMYPDRIEIFSPGGLPSGLSEDDYLYGYVSVLRNPILANLFFRLRYMEAFGTGVRRIYDAYRDTDQQPQFTCSENSLSVILPVLSASVVLTEDEQTVLSTLQTNLYRTSRQISDASGFEKSKTIRLLNHLIQLRKVEKTGQGRGVYYRRLS